MGWVCRMFPCRSGSAVVKQLAITTSYYVDQVADVSRPSFAGLGSMIARCSWKGRQHMNLRYHYCSKTVDANPATVRAFSGSVLSR